jgi:hypothetical protein
VIRKSDFNPSSALLQFPLVEPILSTMAKKGNHFSPRPGIPLQMNTNHFQQPSPAQSPCASSPWLWQDTTRPSYDLAHTDLWACWNTIPLVRLNTLICQFWPGELREKIRSLMGPQDNFLEADAATRLGCEFDCSVCTPNDGLKSHETNRSRELYTDFDSL